MDPASAGTGATTFSNRTMLHSVGGMWPGDREASDWRRLKPTAETLGGPHMPL
jgi:hypothetical protein